MNHNQLVMIRGGIITLLGFLIGLVIGVLIVL